MWRRGHNPLRFRPLSIDALTSPRYSHLPLSVPDELALVAAISENVSNGRDAPRSADSSLMRLRRGHAFGVQQMSDFLQRSAGGVEFKHPPNNRGLALANLELYAVRPTHAPISKNATPCMHCSQRATLHSTMGLQAKLAGIDAIDQAVHPEEYFCLGAVRIDALGHCNQTHSGKRKTFVQVQRVGEFSSEAGCVVDQDGIECACRVLSSAQESLKTHPRGSGPTDRLIDVEVFIENRPSFATGVFPALTNLVVDRDGGLTITAETSVDGAAEPPPRAQGGPGSVVPGCPKCRKRIGTMPQFLDHLANDAIPALLDRLSEGGKTDGG